MQGSISRGHKRGKKRDGARTTFPSPSPSPYEITFNIDRHSIPGFNVDPLYCCLSMTSLAIPKREAAYNVTSERTSVLPLLRADRWQSAKNCRVGSSDRWALYRGYWCLDHAILRNSFVNVYIAKAKKKKGEKERERKIAYNCRSNIIDKQ